MKQRFVLVNDDYVPPREWLLVRAEDMLDHWALAGWTRLPYCYEDTKVHIDLNEQGRPTERHYPTCVHCIKFEMRPL